MTPDERTTVLAAILKYDPQFTSQRAIVCPTSWMQKRLALGASDQTLLFNWLKLSYEEQLAVWLEAPDSDYEYARDRTHILNPRLKGSLLP